MVNKDVYIVRTGKLEAEITIYKKLSCSLLQLDWQSDASCHWIFC